ncbi:hypothetical protein PQC34_gp039 [Cronobacter phage A24]|uniref:Uncharacterized protein n=1 Tax=Cronobacter phage A24 TaxID=2795745 RepID=A0A7T5QXW7_9CAUD|nr:hypothetical protein PQC34_gp039 [Cronobacter phage A24]QQG33695.1 hypothetical protein [Cronobacter phage A24]
MHFELSNGDSVELRGNSQAARFIYLAMPFQGLTFAEGQEKPRITMTPEVRAIIRLSETFRAKMMERAMRLERELGFDDDIPF